jgi:hypothetical protein
MQFLFPFVESYNTTQNDLILPEDPFVLQMAVHHLALSYYSLNIKPRYKNQSIQPNIATINKLEKFICVAMQIILL